jgi:hypothetical protein
MRELYDRFDDGLRRMDGGYTFREVFALDGCRIWDGVVWHGMVIASVDTISQSGLYFDGYERWGREGSLHILHYKSDIALAVVMGYE